MHPVFTLFMSTIVPPLLSLAPSLHAGYALTPQHYASCLFGWVVAWAFWVGGQRRERLARAEGRRVWCDEAESYAARRLRELEHRQD